MRAQSPDHVFYLLRGSVTPKTFLPLPLVDTRQVTWPHSACWLIYKVNNAYSKDGRVGLHEIMCVKLLSLKLFLCSYFLTHKNPDRKSPSGYITPQLVPFPEYLQIILRETSKLIKLEICYETIFVYFQFYALVQSFSKYLSTTYHIQPTCG